jgi:hypothetical protein
MDDSDIRDKDIRVANMHNTDVYEDTDIRNTDIYAETAINIHGQNHKKKKMVRRYSFDIEKKDFIS